MGLKEYINETRGEMKHTSWPTRKQALNYTLLVIGISLVVALVLFVFDAGFLSLLKYFIER